MIPYIILLILPFGFQFILKYTNTAIYMDKCRIKITNNNVVLPVFFFLLMLILAFRDETIGRDLSNYKIIFNAIGNGSLFETHYGIKEPVFQLYNWIFYNYVSDNYQLFLSVTAVITVIPIAYVYCKEKTHGGVKIAIFVNMSTFVMMFSGIRQGMAISISLLAYQSLKEKNFLKFTFFAILASFTHHSGFMTLFLFPLCKIKLMKKDLVWIIPISSIVIMINKYIYLFLVRAISGLDEKYVSNIEYTGALGSFFLFLLFGIFVYMVLDEKKMDDDMFALRNILLFTIILQSFASLNPLAMRMNYYYIILIPMVIGKSFEYVNYSYTDIARKCEVLMSIFFVVIFVYNIYDSFLNGGGSLDTVPYLPFWWEE